MICILCLAEKYRVGKRWIGPLTRVFIGRASSPGLWLCLPANDDGYSHTSLARVSICIGVSRCSQHGFGVRGPCEGSLMGRKCGPGREWRRSLPWLQAALPCPAATLFAPPPSKPTLPPPISARCNVSPPPDQVVQSYILNLRSGLYQHVTCRINQVAGTST